VVGGRGAIPKFAIWESTVCVLKPQGILVALQLVVADDDPLYKDLASSLGISATEAHAGLRRAAQSGLVSTSGKRPVRRASNPWYSHAFATASWVPVGDASEDKICHTEGATHPRVSLRSDTSCSGYTAFFGESSHESDPLAKNWANHC
jgi:hypothetical protein